MERVYLLELTEAISFILTKIIRVVHTIHLWYYIRKNNNI